MITSSDGPIQGQKTQARPTNLPEREKPLTGARRRLGRLINLDERHLIDLQIENEYRRLQARKG